MKLTIATLCSEAAHFAAAESQHPEPSLFGVTDGKAVGTDDELARTANINIADTIFVEAESTADFQMTKGIRDILDNDGNRDDVMAFLSDRYLLQDEEELDSLARELLCNKPGQGYLNMARKVLCWPRSSDSLAGVTGGVQL